MMKMLREVNKLPEGQRGKRRLANRLLFALLVMSLIGLKLDDAWIQAQFYTPYIFPLVGTLYLGDGYFAMKENA